VSGTALLRMGKYVDATFLFYIFGITMESKFSLISLAFVLSLVACSELKKQRKLLVGEWDTVYYEYRDWDSLGFYSQFEVYPEDGEPDWIINKKQVTIATDQYSYEFTGDSLYLFDGALNLYNEYRIKLLSEDSLKVEYWDTYYGYNTHFVRL